MTNTDDLVDFFQIAEKLECEYRLTRMSNGETQAVASHSWNMAMLAIVLHKYFKKSVNLERVLELCALHDLPEAIAHDVPLHQQTEAVKKKKHNDEVNAIHTIDNLLHDKDICDKFAEYESMQTNEAKIVKLLDILDTGIQHMCAKDLSYIGTYNDGFYWKLFFSDKFAARFDFEPVLHRVFDVVRARVAARLKNELGIDYAVFTKEDV